LTLTLGQGWSIPGMNETSLDAVAAGLREQITSHCQTNRIPGYLAGLYHGGAQAVLSHGLANAATAAPMRADTGFLFGSIAKVMTATLLLQQVERGTVDLDERVVTYLPEFRLVTLSAAERIRVRHLLSHTNGIDADLFFPDARGRDALKIFVERLGRHCGTLFEPGEYVSYSNGGVILVGRLLEVVTGIPYHDLLQQDVYATVGMVDSCTSADQAILRSTAVGHFPDPATMAARRTDMFTLPDTWAPAGGTQIGTIRDLLALGRTQLAGGISPSGVRVLSPEMIERMRTVSHDMRTPNSPPVGHGWMLLPFGDTTVLAHSGASPGGVAVLVVVPEHDFVFAAFGNDPRAMALHEQLLLGLLGDHLGVDIPDLLSGPATQVDLARYAGTYRSQQLRVDVAVVDGQLEETMTYEPADAEQERIFAGFSGGQVAGAPPRRFVPVGPDLFAPAGMPLTAFNGYSRIMLVSYHGGTEGRAGYRCAGGRMTRRASES
jgi:CubicO group peptidase (beta-lactamase class C family)